MDFESHAALYFRNDGTPKYVSFSRPAKNQRQPGISIDTMKFCEKRVQSYFSVPSKDVEETWAEVGNVWLKGVGLSRKDRFGRCVHEWFLASLPNFLERYQVKSAKKWIFTEEW